MVTLRYVSKPVSGKENDLIVSASGNQVGAWQTSRLESYMEFCKMFGFLGQKCLH